MRFQNKFPEKRIQREVKPASDEEYLQEPKKSEEYRKLLKIIWDIKQHPLASPFLYQLDKETHPDYYEKIKEPMDLSSIETKLKQGEYETSYQFALDMRLIWNNSFFYNSNNSSLYSSTMQLSVYFENLMKGNENLVLGVKKDIVKDLYKKIDKLSQGVKEAQNKPKSIIKPANDKPMGYLEKKQLCENIKKIEPKYLKGVLDIVKECTDIKGEELEFDIDKLPARVCRELDKYTKQCLQNSSRSQKPKKTGGSDIRPPQDFVPNPKELDTNKANVYDKDVYIPTDSDASSESSSTSESEEEVPDPELEAPKIFNQRSDEGIELKDSYENNFY